MNESLGKVEDSWVFKVIGLFSLNLSQCITISHLGCLNTLAYWLRKENV